MKKLYCFAISIMAFFCTTAFGQQQVPERPRIIISTDIGGTDPDDNQSMFHYLLYANEFDCEGLISSPSFGDGDKSEILRMIDLYEKDLPKLKKALKAYNGSNRHRNSSYPSPKYLRSITKQGSRMPLPFCGYAEPTEGSQWIVRCARGNAGGRGNHADNRPLYVLVWGGLDDVAQALHDAPDIADKIRVYWIGGPNKKWGINAYDYIIRNHPDLWMIENNSTYRGFIANYKNPDKWNAGFYEHYVKGCGHLGADYYSYLKGLPKLGDTPSLLYMMDGNPAEPSRESWGGSFERCQYTPRVVFHHTTTAKDTAQIYSIIEWHIRGPKLNDSLVGKACITLDIAKQSWKGYYVGNGDYVAKYSTYKTGTQPYTISSDIDGFPRQEGFITIENVFPGKHRDTDYQVGAQWWTDKSDNALFYNGHQGANTIYKWRKAVMENWGKRCAWLK